MVREEDDDDGLPPIGEGTEVFLEDAKKGKPRRFLLICKGSKVKYLRVGKKAITNSAITQAKKLGYKGDSYIGVLTGKGMELVFNLAISDGYESEPVKDKILKDFLEEHAGFKCKPSFAIVATPPDIPFDEEDLSHPLIARFLALGELISQILDARPEAQGELKQTTSGIRVLLQDGSFEEAEPKINLLEARLKELASGESLGVKPEPTAPPPTSPSSEAVTEPDPLKKKLLDALGKLVPQLKEAVAKFPDKKVELLTPVATIKGHLEKGELQSARDGILSVGGRLKSLLASSEVPSTTETPTPQDMLNALRQEYEQKLALVQPLFDKAIQEMLGDVDKFRSVRNLAFENAEAGTVESLQKAKTILDRLGTALDQAIAAGVKATSVIPEGVVADRKKFLFSRWQDAVRTAYSEIEKIVAPISSQVPEEDAASLAASITKHLDGFVDELNRAILGSQTASSKNMKPIEDALKVIQSYRTLIATDPLLMQLDESGSELGVEVKVSELLLLAISELEQNLAS